MATKVDLELTVAIPSAAVLYSVLGYGGAFNGGAKCRPKAVVDLDKPGGNSLMVPQLAWEITYKYKDDDVVAVAGKPGWYRTLRSGATSIDSQTLERNVNNLNVQLVQMDGATHAVKFTVVGANPFLTLAPAIDADVVVGLRKVAGGIQYAVKGGHDGFPTYTLLVNGKQVYSWDCAANNKDPSALLPPMDQSVDTGWNTL